MSDRPYDRLTWRGYRWDYRTQAAVQEVEERLGKRLTIFQGSYNTSVGASAGTHDGGGAIDCWLPGAIPETVVRTMRNVGWAAWHRTPQQGPWDDHIHAILLDHHTSAPLAKAQCVSYDNGGTGLASNGADPQPYRPKPPVTFSYPAWVKERTLKSRLRAQLRNLRALRDRVGSTRKRLRKVRTS